MTELGFRDICEVIKPLMKKKKITYADVAEELGLSESSVKKLFNSDDCSISRLNSICRLLGVEINELFAELSQRPPTSVRLTEKQDDFLADDPVALKVFLFLIAERCSLQGLQDGCKLSRPAVYKYLRKMDQLGLIDLGPNDQIRIKAESTSFLEDHGRTIKKIKLIGPEFLKIVATAPPQSVRFRFRYYEMRKATYQKFLDELEDVENKYIRISSREERFSGEETQPVTLTMGIAPMRLSDVLGQVTIR